MEARKKRQVFYDNDLVSVIIPVYNGERFVEEAVRSAVNQTYSKIEVIVVDDCSEDSTRRLVEKLASFHQCIRYYALDRNSGPGIARKEGVKYAEGRYIAFLDSDDIWRPAKIEHQIRLLREKDADFSYTAIKVIDENGKSLNRHIHVKDSVNYSTLQKNTMIATSSVLLDRNGTGDLEMSTKRLCEDYATWLKLLRGGRIAYGIDKPLVYYRETKKSLSSNPVQSMKNVWLTQVKEEKINWIKAGLNVICYAGNAFKKHYL